MKGGQSIALYKEILVRFIINSTLYLVVALPKKPLHSCPEFGAVGGPSIADQSEQ
jgi:hypothetical protein